MIKLRKRLLRKARTPLKRIGLILISISILYFSVLSVAVIGGGIFQDKRYNTIYTKTPSPGGAYVWDLRQWILYGEPKCHRVVDAKVFCDYFNIEVLDTKPGYAPTYEFYHVNAVWEGAISNQGMGLHGIFLLVLAFGGSLYKGQIQGAGRVVTRTTKRTISWFNKKE